MTTKLCEIIQLPPIDVSNLVDPEATLVTRLCVMMREIKPAFKSAVSSLSFRPAAIIVDLFGTEYLEVAKELEIPKYVFIGSNAWFLALTLYTPILDKEVEGEFVDHVEPLKLPGCISVRPEDVVNPMLEQTNQEYFEYLRTGKEIPMADALFINTWEALEPSTLAALRDVKHLGQIVYIPVLPIGPRRRQASTVDNTPMHDELLGWLDRQPERSIVYVSFGSGVVLSIEQTNELAWGLELSEQRFIWVVRPPVINPRDGSCLTARLNSSDEDDM